MSGWSEETLLLSLPTSYSGNHQDHHRLWQSSQREGKHEATSIGYLVRGSILQTPGDKDNAQFALCCCYVKRDAFYAQSTALVLCSRKSVENGVLCARMGGCLPTALCTPDNTLSLISPARKSGAWGTSPLKFHMALKSKALGSALPRE